MSAQLDHPWWMSQSRSDVHAKLPQSVHEVFGLFDNHHSASFHEWLHEYCHLDAAVAFRTLTSQAEPADCELPQIPHVDQNAPDQINTYTDGSLNFPCTPKFALSSAAVWAPGRILQLSEIELDYLH
eukprot:5237364-Karenia_brevis.AAC.1